MAHGFEFDPEELDELGLESERMDFMLARARAALAQAGYPYEGGHARWEGVDARGPTRLWLVIPQA